MMLLRMDTSAGSIARAMFCYLTLPARRPRRCRRSGKGRILSVIAEIYFNLKRGGRTFPIALRALSLLGAHPPGRQPAADRRSTPARSLRTQRCAREAPPPPSPACWPGRSRSAAASARSMTIPRCTSSAAPPGLDHARDHAGDADRRAALRRFSERGHLARPVAGLLPGRKSQKSGRWQRAYCSTMCGSRGSSSTSTATAASRPPAFAFGRSALACAVIGFSADCSPIPNRSSHATAPATGPREPSAPPCQQFR